MDPSNRMRGSSSGTSSPFLSGINMDNMRKGKDYIGYLQLADSPDRHEPGTGEVNYTQIFKSIKQIGYMRPVGLECTPQGGDVVRAARRIYAADTW